MGLSRKESYKQNKNSREKGVIQMIDKHKIAQANYKAGLALLLEDHPLKALNMFTKAIELDPNIAEYYCDRGDLLYELGKHDKALKDLTKAVELDPNIYGRLEMQRVRYQAPLDRPVTDTMPNRKDLL